MPQVFVFKYTASGAIKTARMIAAMFATEMKEKTDGVVKLNDMGAKGLKIFLKFLYSGELDDKWSEFYSEIINAASKYQINRLLGTCENLLPTLVSWENCVEVLELAELHGMTRAAGMIKAFIKSDSEKSAQLWLDSPARKRRRLN
ncbi:Speckle-type POZ protein [Folsomia candida]|uniref:Speckle-type POZ protein n=2 Tax=Folsomia candida TaxID=158441 RepID=A0A226DLX2_FOLCA|nr:Speckle-type POZ protein [Folsomia candida]